MQHAAAAQKTSQATAQNANPDLSAGPSGIAIMPPTYGIPVVDRGRLVQSATVELHSDRSAAAGVLQRACACGKHAGSGGDECEECRQKREGRLQRAAMSNYANSVPPIVHDVLASPGEPLDAATRAFMEPRFGHDFGGVRVHSDWRAAKSARAVQANAYTVGNHVAFGPGQYQPRSSNGTHLLAHELSHVVQQSRGGVPPGIDGDLRLERAAERAANQLATTSTPVTVGGASGIGIARDPKPSEQVLYEVKFPDGIRRLTAAEFEAQKQVAIRRLRSRLKLTADYADIGRSSQIDMLKEYHGGVESLSDIFHKPKALIGIAADIRAGVTPPYIGMWSHAKTTSAQGLAALDRGDLAEAARLLSLADAHYRDAMREWNAYREATIGGAEAVASNLETVRDVSFAIALVAGAALAAPVVAGAVGVGGLGLTGVTATGLTTVGTAGATGVLGASLGGGSAAIASYANTGKVDRKAVIRDAAKFGKQGVVTGLTAGLGSAVGASKIAQPLIQQALKRCAAEAGVNLAGEVTAATLDKLVSEETPDRALQAGDPQPATQAILSGPARAALTGCIGGILGVPINKLGSGVVRKSVDVAVGAGMGYADARLSGQGNTEALVAAVQGTATHLAISHAQEHTSRPGAKKATHKAPSKTPSNTHAPSALPKPDIPAAPHAAEATASSIPDHPNAPSTAADREAAAAHAAEKLTGQIKGSLVADVAPAILKEDAIAKKPTADGHEVVVTKQGVAKCSPSPCPVIHVEYAKELAEHPELKQWNDKIQALRKTDPNQAADAADRLIRTLEAARSNTLKRGSNQNGGPEPSLALHIGEKRAEQIRSGEKNFAIDRALTFDIDEVLPVGAADIKPQRAVGRALDPYNRQLLDPNTNQRTKGLGIDVRELREHRGEHKPVSVVGNPTALITKRFSEVHELKRIFDRAVASVKEPQKLTPTQLKAHINRETRRIITEDPGPDAAAVRAALAELGFERQAKRGFTITKQPPP